MELSTEWSCHNLGYKLMTIMESKHLRESGFDHEALVTLGVTQSRWGRIKPFVATCSATAKLLHFGGKQKPWMFHQKDAFAMCSITRAMFWSKWTWTKSVRVF